MPGRKTSSTYTKGLRAILPRDVAWPKGKPTMQQNAAVSIAQELFPLAQRGVWAKALYLLILQFSIKPRDVSGATTAQISKFCWVFFFAQRRLCAKTKTNDRENVVFFIAEWFFLLAQRGVWSKKYMIANFSVFLLSTDVSGAKNREKRKFC